MRARIQPDRPEFKGRNIMVSDAFDEACNRKFVKREMRRRWPEWVEQLHGNFKIELK